MKQDQTGKYRSRCGGSSSGPGGNLQPYFLFLDLPCGSCYSLNLGTVLWITLLCGVHLSRALGAGSYVWNPIVSKEHCAFGAAKESKLPKLGEA